ncbi:hypothetical protein T484DRAFT_1648232, partial [Baffinella frigidus]
PPYPSPLTRRIPTASYARFPPTPYPLTNLCPPLNEPATPYLIFAPTPKPIPPYSSPLTRRLRTPDAPPPRLWPVCSGRLPTPRLSEGPARMPPPPSPPAPPPYLIPYPKFETFHSEP